MEITAGNYINDSNILEDLYLLFSTGKYTRITPLLLLLPLLPLLKLLLKLLLVDRRNIG